jgi:23S rRNA (guanosine2251-2'-O)-methyltransferase
VKTEILCGVHAVQEALAAGRRDFIQVCVDRGQVPAGRLQSLLAAAEAAGVAVRSVDAARLASMAGTSGHQGVAARVSPYRVYDLANVLDDAGRPETGLILALDQIVDPHNLGAVLRTALCAGVEAVIVPRDRSAPPTPAVSRVSAGALEHIRLVAAPNLVRALQQLKARGRWIAGLDQAATDSLFSADLTLPLVLVLGGEERGIRPLVHRTCDLILSIPQSGPLDSLNVSVAAGIALFEVRRQREAAARPSSSKG